MKKIFELAIKSQQEIEMNEENMVMIKKTVEDSIVKTIGSEKYNEFSYQCNCIKLRDNKTGEHLVLVKVYGWPRNQIEETNFFLNVETPEVDSIPNLDEEETNIAKNEIIKLQEELSTNEKDLNDIDAAIDMLLDTGITPESKEKLTLLTQKRKPLKEAVEKTKKRIEYIKSEFYIK